MKRLAAIVAGMVAGALAVAAGAALAAEEEPFPYATGAAPSSPAQIAAVPAVPSFRASFPVAVDLSGDFPRPGFQGQQATCVAWATAYAASSFFHGERTGRRPDEPADLMSPAYLYHQLKPRSAGCSTPLTLVDALSFLKRTGTVSLADFPTDVTQCDAVVPAQLAGKAEALRLRAFERIRTETLTGFRRPVLAVDDIKGALSQRRPIVFVMALPRSFATYKTGVYQHLTPFEQNRHAMAITGYDDRQQAFRVLNSWAPTWGDGGYIWVGYDTFRTLATEAYQLVGPPAAAGGAAGVGGSLDRLLATAPNRCSVIRSERAGGRTRLTGFTGDERFLEALRAAAGRDAAVDVALHRYPQCEAEQTLQRQLADSPIRIAVTEAGGAPRAGDPVAMRAGELFGINVTTVADLPFLSIVYIQADNSAVELYRGTPTGGRVRTISIGQSGAAEHRFQVGPPFGEEMVVAIASKRPLFGVEAADYTTERRFLSGLRARMLRLPAGDAAAAVLRLRTSG